MLVSTEHFERAHNFRVSEVVDDLRFRPERLYPRQKFTPDPGVIWEITVPKEKNRFASIEEALAAVRKWCPIDD